MKWFLVFPILFLFLAPFLYCNDLCLLHVHSFPPLGGNEKGQKWSGETWKLHRGLQQVHLTVKSRIK